MKVAPSSSSSSSCISAFSSVKQVLLFLPEIMFTDMQNPLDKICHVNIDWLYTYFMLIHCFSKCDFFHPQNKSQICKLRFTCMISSLCICWEAGEGGGERGDGGGDWGVETRGGRRGREASTELVLELYTLKTPAREPILCDVQNCNMCIIYNNNVLDQKS